MVALLANLITSLFLETQKPCNTSIAQNWFKDFDSVLLRLWQRRQCLIQSSRRGQMSQGKKGYQVQSYKKVSPTVNALV